MDTNCIVCRTRPVNPMVGSGKSFCSRICESLYWDVTLQFLPTDRLKRLADAQHAKLAEYVEETQN